MSTNEQHTPLTDERLAEIREQAPTASYHKPVLGIQPGQWTFSLDTRAANDMTALLAEVEHLRKRLRDTIESRESFIRHATLAAKERYEKAEAENAAAMEIVQDVAKGPTILGIATMYLCNYCDVYVGGIFGRTDHRAGCPVTKARALLASDEVTP